MVGVRHRRALFPGFSDTADFRFACPEVAAAEGPRTGSPRGRSEQKSYSVSVPDTASGRLRVVARLKYRKIDQFLLDFITERPGALTAPVTEMSKDVKTVQIVG
jgi:hypothetical protein